LIQASSRQPLVDGATAISQDLQEHRKDASIPAAGGEARFWTCNLGMTMFKLVPELPVTCGLEIDAT